MLPFLYTAVVYVVGRMLWYSDDRPRPWTVLAAIGALQSILIAAAVRAPLVWYIAVAGLQVTLALAAAATESMVHVRESARLASRLCGLVIGAVALGYAAGQGGVVIRPAWSHVAAAVASRLAFGSVLASVSWPPFWSRTLGAALCLSEGGTVVRLSMVLLEVQPPAPGNNFQRSGLIGSVERLLVLVFVLNGAFNAVAFILTAKSVVRFHDIVSTKDAAEYVLIGTLLSTLTAIGIGLLVPLLA